MARPPEDKKAGKSRRDQRLAAALRENLRRRKAQVRHRGKLDKPAPVAPDGGNQH